VHSDEQMTTGSGLRAGCPVKSEGYNAVHGPPRSAIGSLCAQAAPRRAKPACSASRSGLMSKSNPPDAVLGVRRAFPDRSRNTCYATVGDGIAMIFAAVACAATVRPGALL
jgi:hypothetical protein